MPVITSEIRKVIHSESELPTENQLHHIGLGWVVKRGYQMGDEPNFLTKKWFRWHFLKDLFSQFDMKVYESGKGSTFCSKIGATLLASDTVFRNLTTGETNLLTEKFKNSLLIDIARDRELEYRVDELKDWSLLSSVTSLVNMLMTVTLTFIVIHLLKEN